MPRALITGCSTGIGRATADELRRRGYDVIATARRLATIADLEAAAHLELDVTDDESVRRAVRDAGPVDVLVNNAGVGCWGPIEMIPFDEVRRLVDTNVLGVIRMLQAVLPGMRVQGGGTIVNVSSAAGRARGAPGIALYGMTKHAVEVLSEALRYEVLPFGIRVIVVEPGAIATSFADNRIVAGLSGPPYEAMAKGFEVMRTAHTGEPSSGSAVATVIADALEEDHPALRRPASPDAAVMIDASEHLGERDAEADYQAAVAAMNGGTP